MKLQRPNIFVFILGTISSLFVSAQKAVYLAPVPHKLLYADTVYREAIAKKDTLLLAEAYYLYGKTYEGTGDYLTSSQWLYKSLKLLEPRGDSPELSRLYLRIAAISNNSTDYHASLRYINLALNIAKRTSSYKLISRAYGGLAEIHKRDWSEEGKKPGYPGQRLDSAMYYMNKSKLLAVQKKDSSMIANINIAIGDFLWRYKRDTTACLRHYRWAENFFEEKKEDYELVRMKLVLANFYLDINQPDKAIGMLKMAKGIYDRNPFNDVYMKGNLEAGFSRYYEMTKNWELAYAHTSKSHQLQIGNYIADRNGAVTRLSKEYEMEKKDILLKAKDSELALRDNAFMAQQRFMIVSFILLIVTAAMSLVFYRLYKKNLHISRQNGLLVKEQNHRVKNNLQAISSLLSLQSDELTDPRALRAIEESRLRVEAIGILHRKLYDGKQLAMVFLPDFLKDLTTGVLDTYGFDSLKTDFKVDEIHLPPDLAVHVGLIINELLTNACKYAFPGNDNPKLRIACSGYLKRKQKYIHLEVADNGPGISDQSSEKPIIEINPRSDHPQAASEVSTAIHSGFGMKLIQMEAEQLYATSEFHYDGGTIFTMDFLIAQPQVPNRYSGNDN